MDLLHAFRRVVLARAQVNGSFFTKAGMDLAVDRALERMEVMTAASIVLPRIEPSTARIAAAKPGLLVNQ
jgi:capsular polysaccharide export protein